MIRYAQYIVSILALFAFSACSFEEVELPAGSNSLNDNVVTIMGRVAHYTDYEVTTRGAKQGDETKITSTALAIFKLNNGGTALDGNCVYYQNSIQNELVFTIDRANFDRNARYAIYAFANIPGMSSFRRGSSLADMLKVATEVKGIDVPSNGFPMMGSLGDTFSANFDKDGQVFILAPSNGDDLTAPTVNGNAQNVLTIPMKSLYAKMNFNISVRPDQSVEGNYAPQFTLTSYKLKDVSESVDCDNSTETVVIEEFGGLPIAGNLSASGANSINFSFYLPERLLTPETSAKDYVYPFGKGSDVREEDKKYMQRYKSKLLGSSQKATHIEISGRYRDHQNHYYNVTYTIYLGKDNYSDFNILRNSEYNNYITIKGIHDTDDQGEGTVSLDHRVNVERTQPAIINLHRETLLDSHFEVRPLRIIASGIDGIGDINAIMVEVLESSTTNWMRIERSGGVGTSAEGKDVYITTGVSKGKRKYFTYNLVSGKNASGVNDSSGYSLANSTSVTVPLSSSTDDCVWIYVDECLDEGDEVRTGQIKLTYGSTKSGSFVPTTNAAFPPVVYTINQRKLFPVTYGGRKYNIEYHEEYLHNYDSDDEYLQTEYEGMAWGLDGVQLSYDKQAILIHNSGMESLTSPIKTAVLKNSPYYDFYLTRDFVKSTYYFANDNEYNNLVHEYNGYNFCNDIIAEVNSTKHSSNTSDDIKQLTLAQEPKSAIEYCYNKNKRDANGNVVLNNNTGWYLPAIDETEGIMMSTYGDNQMSYARFKDFQNKYYWSSQPAYYQNIIFGDRSLGDRMGYYMIDNVNYARSTRVNFLGGDPNSPQNYTKAESGMEKNTYFYYMHITFKSTWSDWLETTLDASNTYKVEDLVKNNGNVAGGSANGTRFQFSWSNNTSSATESVYPPQYEEGYKHRLNSKARVRCVRKK